MTDTGTPAPMPPPPARTLRVPVPPRTTRAASRMALANISKGIIDVPVRVCLHGDKGSGKSTAAANAENPVFICAEDGTAHLDVARFPQARCWSEIREAVHVLTVEEHPYRTLVIDTLDWAERLIWDHLVERAHDPKIQTIEDFGYGKG